MLISIVITVLVLEISFGLLILVTDFLSFESRQRNNEQKESV